MPQNDEIRVIAPDGTHGSLPRDNWDAARAQGFRLETTMVPNRRPAQPEQPGLLARVERGLSLPPASGMGAGATIATPGNIVGGLVGAAKGLTRGLLGEPNTPAQGAGQFLERTMEYTAAGEGAGALTAGRGLIPQMAAQGAGQGLVAASQGASPGEIGIATGAGAAGPLVARGAEKVMGFISRRMTARQINSVLGVSKKMLRSADDLGPGARLQQDGVMALSRDSLRSQVSERLAKAGTQLDDALAANARNTISNVDDSVLEAFTSVRNKIRQPEASLMRQLDTNLTNLANEIPNRPMTPAEVHALKVRVGDSIRWNLSPDVEDPLNDALISLYWKLTDSLSEAVPGVRELQSRWRDYYNAFRAIDDRIRGVQVSAPTAGTGMGLVQRMTRIAPVSGPATLLGQATGPAAVEASRGIARAGRGGLLVERNR